MPKQTLQTIAQQAYEAYGTSLSWTNFQGGPLPQWDDLPELVQSAWVRGSYSAILAWRALSAPDRLLEIDRLMADETK